MNTQKMICITGITCTGKDTLVERMAERWPDDVGLIQVGKEFRRRYPPERFRGLAAMPDTEVESWQIFDEQLAAAKDKKMVLVTGQPRLPSQVNEIMKRCGEPPIFYALTCTEQQLADRIVKRFDNQQDGWLTLAKQRVHNDKAQLYDVMLALYQWDVTIHTVYNTTDCLDAVCESIYRRHV